MLNPNEIGAKRFDKSVSGYKVDDVEAFLDRVAQDYAQLMNDQYELERKIEVLAEKLEEYKRDEDSLKSAVFEAQKLGSSLIRDAKAKADHIIQEANEKAGLITAEASNKADQMLEETSATCAANRREQELAIAERSEYYDRLRAEVAAFKNLVVSSYQQHLTLLDALPGEIEDKYSREVASGEQPKSEPAPIPEPEPVDTPAAAPVIPEPSYDPEAAPEPQYDEAADSLSDMPIEETAPAAIPMTVADPKPGDSFGGVEEPPREMPPARERHGLLKFGDNYNMREERERGRRRK